MGFGISAALVNISAFEFLLDAIECRSFILGPHGGDEHVARGIAHQAHDNSVGRKQLKTVGNERGIGVETEQRDLALAVHSFQYGLPDNVEMVEFDRVEAQIDDVTDRGAHIVRRFAREAEDEMGTEVEVAQAGSADGIVKGGNAMAAIDEGKGLIVTGFEAEFKPNIGARGVVGEEVEHRVGDAVGACANG